MADSQQRVWSGLYRGKVGDWELELRVDVDGPAALGVVSGDFFEAAGGTTIYVGSFTARPVAREVDGGDGMRLRGPAEFTVGGELRSVDVVLSDEGDRGKRARVTFGDGGGSTRVSGTCRRESEFFRAVEIEEDAVSEVTPFASYTTEAVADVPGRTLSIRNVYADVGVDLRSAGKANVVAAPPGGSSSSPGWSDAELHASMLDHFSLWGNDPRWRVWLLHADRHENPDLTGVMFDSQDARQRQGAAVFYRAMAGGALRAERERDREHLFTCVHELGHCFNLAHSFEKSRIVAGGGMGMGAGVGAGVRDRFDALSWMNYPNMYVGGEAEGEAGEAAFWKKFGFCFDAPELHHLRHAPRDDIIMGGEAFFKDGALVSPRAFAPPVDDRSGLRLELRCASAVALGEPVVVELKLSRAAGRTEPRAVRALLHPRQGFCQVAIRRAGHEPVLYRPMMSYCAGDRQVVLDDRYPAHYESAYVGYGRNGFYFAHGGVYYLRARFVDRDGSVIVSNTATLRVRNPLTRQDEAAAEVFCGGDQGKLLYLLGSDAAPLADAMRSLEAIVKESKLARHALGAYARLVLGMNAARPFRTLGTVRGEERVKRSRVRPARVEEARRLIGRVREVSKGARGVDNITLAAALRQLAQAQKREGDEQGALDTLEETVGCFRGKGLKAHILEAIESAGRAALGGEWVDEQRRRVAKDGRRDGKARVSAVVRKGSGRKGSGRKRSAGAAPKKLKKRKVHARG